MGYGRVEQVRERISGNFWEEGLRSCIQSQLECLHGWSVRSLLCQLALVRDYSNADRMWAATGFTPLLVNLESMSVTFKASGGSKTCATWNVEKAVQYLYIQIRSPRILLQTMEKSRSLWRFASYGTCRSPLTNANAHCWTLSSARQSLVTL